MNGDESARGKPMYDQRENINLYRSNTLGLWDRIEQAIREEYNAPNATRGEVAAQAWADWLGERGPLGGKDNEQT